MKIRNSVAFVTGANRGLGLALVHELIARGAKTVYAGMREVKDLGIARVVPTRFDVTDPGSLEAALVQCKDTTLLINNAGIARLMGSPVEEGAIELSREIMETNYYGVIRASQSFVPVIQANGGGAIINVLSDAAWVSRPMLAAYSATKAAAWSFTNALRIDLRGKNIQVLGLHVGFMDTDMTNGFEMEKVHPRVVAELTLSALEAEQEEILADAGTRAIKESLSRERPLYLDPSAIV
jgi:NAD(P)-dependent dehydrogenase (short-subunit alcohol dehydrogenase family)